SSRCAFRRWEPQRSRHFCEPVEVAARFPSDGRSMKRITGRFVLLIATAGVLPLLLYGLISVTKLTDVTEQSVSLGNQALAQQFAAQIKLYFDNSHRVLV